MDYLNVNTESRKNIHLNFEERMTIQLRLNIDCHSPYMNVTTFSFVTLPLRESVCKILVLMKLNS